MQIEDISKIKFFKLKDDYDIDGYEGYEDFKILKISNIDYERKVVHAFRYYEYGNDEVEVPFNKFLNDEIEIIDSKPIEEEERKFAEERKKAEAEYREKKKKENEIKDSHFRDFTSPYKRLQEVKLITGYPKKALDFSTKDDRYYLDDCRLENGRLLYSLMTVGTRRNRNNCIYYFLTDIIFEDKHFEIIEESFFTPIKSEWISGDIL